MIAKQIDGNDIVVPLITKEEVEHFKNPFNYTREILEEWDSLPFHELINESDKVVLDIGANVGLFAIHVLPWAETIICVEPTPQHMAIQKTILNRSVEVSEKQANIIHEQSALNSYTGKAKFRTEGINTTMNTLSDRPDSYEVDCITLADLCKKHNLEHVDLCKVDIEGSEVKAITVETVSAVFPIINKFLLETHPRSREMQDHFKSIFEQAGYKVDYVDFNGSIIAYK